MRFFKCAIATLIIHDETTFDLIDYQKPSNTGFKIKYRRKNLYTEFIPYSPYEEFTPLEVEI